MISHCLSAIPKILISIISLIWLFTNHSYASEEIKIPMNIKSLFGDKTIYLTATIYKPEGYGRFPLAIINHGAPREKEKRDRIIKFSAQSKEFLKRGFVVVVPMRRGYGTSEGIYSEGHGKCDNPDYYTAGMESAKDIRAVTDYMIKQPYIDKSKILVVGQSAGGFGALALSSMNVDGIIGIINFAGGRGSIREDFVCTPIRLSQATYEFGKTSKVPTLWIYTENDKFFPPSISKDMYENYIKSGGKARYILLPPFKQDGHSLFGDKDGIPIWTPLVDNFLNELGVFK